MVIKLMADGKSGLIGVNVLFHVEKEHSLLPEHVPILFHVMEKHV